jgi:hypothetical protein
MLCSPHPSYLQRLTGGAHGSPEVQPSQAKMFDFNDIH